MSSTETNFPAKKRLLTICIMASPLLAAVLWFTTREPVEVENSASVSLSRRSQIITVGGVERPITDIRVGDQLRFRSRDGELEKTIDQPLEPVKTIPRDANPAVASVYDAVTTGAFPERLSPVFVPARFDRELYLADPASYLNLHVPGRVFQSAQPGPGVPVVEATSKKQNVVRTGESVRLSVSTEPGMPVTFTSFDIGSFDNGLASISVAANESGIATASFNAAPGKLGEVNVLASSPVASDTVHFNLFILKPASPTVTDSQ